MCFDLSGKKQLRTAKTAAYSSHSQTLCALCEQSDDRAAITDTLEQFDTAGGRLTISTLQMQLYHRCVEKSRC